SGIQQVVSEPGFIHFVTPVPTGRPNRPFPVPTDRGYSPSENPFSAAEDEGIFDSGCSRSMTSNKERLDDFQEFQGEKVTFRGGEDLGNLACLVAHVSVDESVKWHRRMGHVNYKNMNRLAKGNLVREHKDETYPILNDFINLVENQLNKKKNRVAERKNITLIEEARTMLVDSKLPTMFWTEAVRTTCYVLNRVSVTRPHNKTPYALLTGKIPSISHFKPFGCHVTILNTSDHFGKFDGKADEGYIVGYSASDKAYRVYNVPNKRVEESMNLRFLEEKPNVQGLGHEWYFDLDYLTDTLGYKHVQANQSVGTQGAATNPAGTQDVDSDSDYDVQVIIIPSYPSHSIQRSEPKDTSGDEVDDSPFHSADEIFRKELARLKVPPGSLLVPTGNIPVPFGSLPVPTGSIPVPTGNTVVSTDDVPVLTSSSTVLIFNDEPTRFPCPSDLRNHDPSPGIFSSSSYDDEFGAALNNVASTVEVSPMATTRINTIHPQSLIIGDPTSAVQTRSKAFEDPSWVDAMQEEIQQLKFQNVWVLVDLLGGKYAIGTKWILKNKRDARGIVIRNKGRLVAQGLDEGEFQMSAMGELTFFIGSVRTATTPYEATKPKSKNKYDSPVNVHLYRSMIGSLMYLTASRPDIMFAVSACSRNQVTPTTLNLEAVKKIFKYLKGQPKLGLWYPKETPLVLEAYSDSDYAGANKDRKSTTGGCQFLVGVSTLHSDHQPAQNPNPNSTSSMAALRYKDEHNKVGYLLKPTESDDYHQIIDFLRASHVRSPKLGPPTIQATIDKTPYTITEYLTRSRLQLANDDGIADLPIADIYSGMDNLGYVTEGKLTFFKNKFSPQWRFLVHTILHYLSTKSGSWDQFGSHGLATFLRGWQKTSDLNAPVLEHGQSSDPNTASFSRSHKTDAGPFTNVEDAPKVHSLDNELKDHKNLFKDVVGKLVKKVKAMEVKLNTKKRKMVVSDSAQDDGGKKDVDLDVVRALANAVVTVDSNIPSGGTSQIPAAIPSVPAARTPGASPVPPGTSDVPTGASTVPADVPSSVAPAGVSSKGKYLMVEEDIPIKARTFKQMEEDQLGEEAAKRAQVEANASLSKTLLGDDVSEDNFPARMAALIKRKRQALAKKLAQERQN
nr:hypothetical protein [Tanacetum cinerariifolium]